jgi:hypothetical protein
MQASAADYALTNFTTPKHQKNQRAVNQREQVAAD